MGSSDSASEISVAAAKIARGTATGGSRNGRRSASSEASAMPSRIWLAAMENSAATAEPNVR